MSYQVFARKYRPQHFDEVIGQEHITQTLKNAIEQDRLAHAYLFVGPRGTGKTSTARILAKALNCSNGPRADFDPNEDICREIAEGRCMDVFEIDGASNNNVDQIRDLRDNVRFAPTRGKYKVYIIDEVHMLTSAAFNALLKTLEEPPAHVKFIFATTEPQKVLPTILSRCQRFDLRRIPANLIADHLLYIASNEGVHLDESAAMAIAIGADGGLRDAESMLDQLVAFCGNTITQPDVLAVFGFTSQQTVSNLCASILSRDNPVALEMIHSQSENGRDLSRLMSDLIGHLRNLLVYQISPNDIRDEISKDVLEVMPEQAQAVTATHILDLIDLFATAENRMRWAPNKKLHFEIAIIRAIQSLDQVSLDKILDSVTALQSGKTPEELSQLTQTPPKLTYIAAPSVTAPKVVAKSAPKPVAKPVPEPTPQPVATPTPEPPPAAPSASVEQPAAEPTTQAAQQPAETAPVSAPTSTDLPEPAPAPTTPAPVAPPATEAIPPAAPEANQPTPEPDPIPTPTVEPTSAPQPSEENSPTSFDAPDELFIPDHERDLKSETEAETEPAPPSEPVILPSRPNAEGKELPMDGHHIWAQAIKHFRSDNFFHAVLIKFEFVEWQSNTFVVASAPSEKLAIGFITQPERKKALEDFLSEDLGQRIALKVEAREGIYVKPMPPEEEITPVDPLEDYRNDPLIKKALEIFRGELKAI